MHMLRKLTCVFLALLLLLSLPACGSRQQEPALSPEDASSLSSQTPPESSSQELPPPESSSQKLPPPESSSQKPSSQESPSRPVLPSIPESGPVGRPPAIISAPVALLYEEGTDCLLYAQNIHKPAAPASLAKLVTACTALSYLPPDTVFEVGEELDLVLPGSSICLLQKGHKLTLNALLYGLMLRSGNDAAHVIAVHTAREVQQDPSLSPTEALAVFQQLEADFIARLNMKESCFLTPDGFDHEGQYTTAYDLLHIALFALNQPRLAKVMSTVEERVVFASGQVANWKNTNKLLLEGSPYFDPDATGMKTGTTPEAGCCLVASAVKNGKLRIAVVLGCASDAERYENAVALLNL